jgi:hypothetical protein
MEDYTRRNGIESYSRDNSNNLSSIVGNTYKYLIMNIGCFNSKIENATGSLQPTILKAIKLLHQEGNSSITARMIRAKCIEINNIVNWAARLPAICNAMRNTLVCGGVIKGEDRDYMSLTISFQKTQSVSKTESSKNALVKSTSSNKTIHQKRNILPIKQESIYDIERLKDNKIPKLLIIGCSGSKIDGGRQINDNTVNFNQSLNLLRIERRRFYNQLFDNNPKHFYKNHNNLIERYRNAIINENNQLLPAYLRYNGIFYTNELRNNYLKVNRKKKFHILIISGLYGVLEFRDKIIDYHIKINTGGYAWRHNIINENINEFKNNNEISDRDVFYSLSNVYKQALMPVNGWIDLWQGGDRGQASSEYLSNFLHSI